MQSIPPECGNVDRCISVVLGMSTEKNTPSHDTIHCPNLLISPLPTLECEEGVLPAESIMMERYFGRATSGFVALDTMPEISNHSYIQLTSASQ